MGIDGDVELDREAEGKGRDVVEADGPGPGCAAMDAPGRLGKTMDAGDGTSPGAPGLENGSGGSRGGGTGRDEPEELRVFGSCGRNPGAGGAGLLKGVIRPEAWIAGEVGSGVGE